MRLVVVGLVVFALLAAGGVVFFVKRYLDAQTDRIQAESQVETVEVTEEEPPTLILVTGAEMPAGTTISSGSLKWRAWPDEGIEDTFIASEKSSDELEKPFIGAVVRRGIAAGVPITRAMVFKRDAPGFLAGALDAGMRGVAVSVTAESGSAGFILPGDRVDVILTHDVRRDVQGGEGSTPVIGGTVVRFTSETVLRDIRVLAIDQQFDDFEDKATVVKTVSLEVLPKQVEVLSVASSMGKLSLSLRSITAGTEPVDPASFTTDLHISPTLSATFNPAVEAKDEKEEAPPPVEAPPPPPRPTIKVYRGSDATVQELSVQ